MFLSSWTSLFFGYLFNEAHHTSEFEFIQRRSFFFSLIVLCTAWLWNLDFLHIPNYVLSFSTNKRQLLMCLHPSMSKWQLFSFCSLKIYHVLAFWQFLPQYQSWSQVCLSAADAYMANREGWRETALPLPLFCLLL